MVSALPHAILAFVLAMMTPLSRALLAVERLMAPELDAGCRQDAASDLPKSIT